ncbi:MAG: formylglycine-generating enzyme family protein [Terriglobia bacterium]
MSTFQKQTIGTTQEFELTAELVRSIEPLLANPALNRKVEIFDRLVHGKGRLLQMPGNERESLVVSLDSARHTLVRLIDVDPRAARQVGMNASGYFTGACASAEVLEGGLVEITVRHARMRSVFEKTYSPEALEWVKRRGPAETKNQPPREQSASTTAKPNSLSVPGEAAKANQTTAISPSSKEPAEHLPPREDQPVLRHRLPGGNNAPPPPSSHATPFPAPKVQTQQEGDVVVYRRKDSANPPGESETQSDAVVKSGSDVEETPIHSKSKQRNFPKEVDGMRLVPDGDVTLGSANSSDAEKPFHRVSVQAFYLDKFEVTNEEYQRFCAATGKAPPAFWKGKQVPAGLEKHPVVQITWSDALAFARWSGKRLPTEAEWERAAKGPNVTRYAYGNTYDLRKANTEQRRTLTVGSFSPNPYGLYDMTGNVQEWTSSLYAPYPYRKDDGREDVKGTGPRVVRGGSYTSDESSARCLVRREVGSTETLPDTGFRCARDAQ